MNKQTYMIGDNVEKFCAACKEELGHTVKSLTKTGSVSRVGCSKCGRLGLYKQSSKTARAQNLVNQTGEPYSQIRTYRAGQIMTHPTFGTGEVMTVFDTKMIDVLFIDRVRRLIHSRM